MFENSRTATFEPTGSYATCGIGEASQVTNCVRACWIGVTEIFRASIKISDAVSISVSLFLPAKQPAPCILEALPYRKDDMTASWRPEHERFATEFGFAVARVDVQGTGSSGGLASDECQIAERSDLRLPSVERSPTAPLAAIISEPLRSCPPNLSSNTRR